MGPLAMPVDSGATRINSVDHIFSFQRHGKDGECMTREF